MQHSTDGSDNINLAEMMDLAERAARRAGQLLLAGFGQPKVVDSAVGKDIKLAADREAETLILELLQPTGIPILTEESGDMGDAGTQGWRWLVDPLDGTMNFYKGLALCVVSIALWRGEEPVGGVVHDFVNDELFRGVAGHGATLNGRAIAVSSVRDVGQAVLMTGFPLRNELSEAKLGELLTLVRAYKKVRMLGTSALMLAYVACGRADTYMEEGPNLWDFGAGLALVRAAGGEVACVTDGRGPWTRTVSAAATPEVMVRIA